VSEVPVRVALVDDHPTILDSVGRAIAAAPDLALVGSARSASEASALLRGQAVDVVVCDVQMGGEVEGLRLLEAHGAERQPAFLMLSAFDYPTLIRAAHDRGARGYLLKTVEVTEIVAAIRTVAGGGTAFSTATLRRMRAALRRPSEREIEVLQLVVRGASNEEIAAALFLSVKTVESHIRRLFNRYGLMNRTELAVTAIREGWVDASTET
jgi:DNA-binding NarL/FixJ family response regulator